VRTAVLTISNRVSRREADDASGELLARMAEDAGADVDAMEVLPDDLGLIEDRLHHFVDQAYDLILTTGGTGLTPDDVTPEATQLVIDREVPGFAEALKYTPMGMTSREVCGTAGRTLILNFPGNPKAIEQLFPVVGPALGHAVALIHGDRGRAGH
jgi:molybdopterin adenylyltransferase